MENNRNKIEEFFAGLLEDADIKEVLVEFLEELDINELLLINNKYLDIKECWDDKVYRIDELDDTFSDISLYDTLTIIHMGYFNPEYSYFVFDNNGNFQSITNSEIFNYINIKEIADYCIKYNDSLGNEELQDILNCI